MKDDKEQKADAGELQGYRATDYSAKSSCFKAYLIIITNCSALPACVWADRRNCSVVTIFSPQMNYSQRTKTTQLPSFNNDASKVHTDHGQSQEYKDYSVED